MRPATRPASSGTTRDGREAIRIDHGDSEIIAGQRRLVAAKVSPYQPTEFGTPAEQYLTELVFEMRDTHDSGTAARREVHDSRATAQAHLGEHVPTYDDAPRRDAVRHRTEVDVTATDSEGDQ